MTRTTAVLVIMPPLIMLAACSPSADLVPAKEIAASTATAAHTPMPISTATQTPVPPTPKPVHPTGEVVTHYADPSTGYDWYSYVPAGLESQKPAYVLVNGARGQFDCKDVGNSVRSDVQQMSSYAEEHKYILLFPAIPKNCGDLGNVSFVEYGVFDTWVGHFDPTLFANPDQAHYRPDLKVNAMIDQLHEMLQQDGYNVAPRVFVYGFSIGGHFANRYAMLQPARVQAFAAGGLSGEITLPVETYQGYVLNWYLGVGRYEELAGKPFDANTYSSIPQFYFWGSEDLFPMHRGHCTRGFCWGNDSPAALQSQCEFLQGQISDLMCKEYQGIGHEFTPEMYDDVFEFFDQYK